MQSIAGNVISNDLQEGIQSFVNENLEKLISRWNLKTDATKRELYWNLSFYPRGCSNEDKEYLIINHMYNSIAFKIIMSPRCEKGLSIKNISTNHVSTLCCEIGEIIMYPCSFIYPVQINSDFDGDVVVVDGQIIL
jgi:hypothetical protein